MTNTAFNDSLIITSPNEQNQFIISKINSSGTTKLKFDFYQNMNRVGTSTNIDLPTDSAFTITTDSTGKSIMVIDLNGKILFDSSKNTGFAKAFPKGLFGDTSFTIGLGVPPNTSNPKSEIKYAVIIGESTKAAEVKPTTPASADLPFPEGRNPQDYIWAEENLPSKTLGDNTLLFCKFKNYTVIPAQNGKPAYTEITFLYYDQETKNILN